MFARQHPITTLVQRWRLRHLLKKHPIAHHAWKAVTRHIKVLEHLDAVERTQLRAMVTWFLFHKTISGAHGLDVTAEMKLTVAVLACLPVLKLGFSYLDGWSEVILYPGAFRANNTQVDESGLVHEEANALSGQAWLRGPLILSWEDVVQNAFQLQPGRNVVIHEIAHKLDGLNGAMNGMPPLHRVMIRKNWTQSFSNAYEDLRHQLAAGHHPLINPYATTNPAEFFAVVSEYYFTAPQILAHHYPDLYRQLIQFYRQQTIKNPSFTAPAPSVT
jgi:MtfA peptidase